MPATTNLLPKQGTVRFYDTVVSTHESDSFYQSLLTDIAWRHDPIIMFGKMVMQPRLTAWYGDSGAAYSYSGIDLIPLPWTPELIDLRKKIQAFTGVNFNSALLNLYRDGDDYMGYHRDNEKTLGKNAMIASMSFGAQRKFLFKHISDKDAKISINLTHGSLLMMEGETQHFWYHSLPKSKKVTTPRINVTFRNVFNE